MLSPIYSQFTQTTNNNKFHSQLVTSFCYNGIYDNIEHKVQPVKIAEEYVKDIDKFLPCPAIALKILKIAHEEGCNINELSRNIEKDPGLTANMLKMANSAYFGHMKQIQSITDIIIRLGMESVKLIAITSASAGLLNSGQKAYNLKNGTLWRHSYATAILASIICRYAEEDEAASIYTAALLHDIGKVVLDKHLAKGLYNAPEPNHGLTMVEYERSFLHTDHAQVGEALLRKWGLPEYICLLVGNHHRDDNNKEEAVASKIVRLANIVTAQIGFQSLEETSPLKEVEEFLKNEQNLPNVPNFVAKKEKIIDEFFEKYNENETIFFNQSDQK